MVGAQLNNGYLTFKEDGNRLMRRVQGFHDIRLDGIGDLLFRARGAEVLDIGCNIGLVGFEFANNGAVRVMGIDNDHNGIICARYLFRDLRNCNHRFEIVDLRGGEVAIREAFIVRNDEGQVVGNDADLSHDIVLMLATYHKLKRVMPAPALSALMQYFGKKTRRYFGWRGHPEELEILDADLGKQGLRRIQTSVISDIQPAAIWARPQK